MVELRYRPGLLPAADDAPLLPSRSAWVDRARTALVETPDGGVPQHRLLIGPAGTGKSLLLDALRRALGDATGAGGWAVARLPDELGEVLSVPDLARVVRRALHLEDGDLRGLRAATAGGRRIAVLVDDVARLFHRLGDGLWELREVLSGGDLALVGASRTLPAAAYEYDGAFYDFFAVDRLAGLTLEETATFLRAPAGSPDRTPGLLRMLHDLSGGVPRLLQAARDRTRDQAEEPAAQLASILDAATAEHRAVLDALSDQARAVLVALANAGEPAAASDIAGRLGMPSNKVSAYLNRLGGDGLVEKVPLHDARTTGYQIVDRTLSLGCRARSGDPAGVRELARAMTALWDSILSGAQPAAAEARSVFGDLTDALHEDPAIAVHLPPELRALARAWAQPGS